MSFGGSMPEIISVVIFILGFIFGYALRANKIKVYPNSMENSEQYYHHIKEVQKLLHLNNMTTDEDQETL